MDKQKLQGVFNEVDFCLRLRERGLRNVWTPYAQLYHHESASWGRETTPENKKRFAAERNYRQQRWGDILANDPCYSPNLTLHYIDKSFSLAWPPRINKY